jgi:hypothetical protein
MEKNSCIVLLNAPAAEINFEILYATAALFTFNKKNKNLMQKNDLHKNEIKRHIQTGYANRYNTYTHIRPQL